MTTRMAVASVSGAGCSRDLRARLAEPGGEKRKLEARRERLELPAVGREMLEALVENFEPVMAEGPAPKRSTFSTGW